MNTPVSRAIECPNGLTAQLGKATVDEALAYTPRTEPATQAIAIARQAVAEVAREDGDHAFARFAMNGAYDDDPEVRIALAALRIAQTPSPAAEEPSRGNNRDGQIR